MSEKGTKSVFKNARWDYSLQPQAPASGGGQDLVRFLTILSHSKQRNNNRQWKYRETEFEGKGKKFKVELLEVTSCILTPRTKVERAHLPQVHKHTHIHDF